MPSKTELRDEIHRIIDEISAMGGMDVTPTVVMNWTLLLADTRTLAGIRAMLRGKKRRIIELRENLRKSITDAQEGRMYVYEPKRED